MNQAIAKLYAAMYFYTNAGVEKLKKNERGQGTLEYVGMIAVAAIIVVALITLFNGSLKTDITNFVTTTVHKITNSGS